MADELLAPPSAEADPFAQILPASVKASLDEHDARARATVREISELTSAAIRTGQETLAQLDLPWALQAVEQDADPALKSALPAKLAAELASMRGSGGVGAIGEQIEAMGQSIASCADVSTHVRAVLAEEGESERKQDTDHER